MAEFSISSARPRNNSQSLTTALASAMLEWLLMFLLLIDAIFSYVIIKFAHGCKLQVPCLICSRLDHVFGKEKKGYYWDLICANHKSEMSSLVLCHAHSKKGIKRSFVSLRNSGVDPSSHNGNAELKITSDTESGAPLSDYECASDRICETDGFKEALSVPLVEPHIINLVDDLASEKHIDPSSGSKPGHFVSQASLNAADDNRSAESNFPIGHETEAIKWQQVACKDDIPTLTKPNLNGAAPSLHAMEKSSGITYDSYINSTDKVGQMYTEECREAYKLGENTSETGLETNSLTSDSRQQVSNILDLGDAYKLAVGNNGKKFSGALTEQWIRKDSSKVSEDLKLLLSQLSANRGIEQSANDLSPKFSVNIDDVKGSDSFNYVGIQILQKRMSLERNESGLSLDGSIVSEIQGESVVDRLKRQIEHDKKLMIVLHRELEEERNASAVAAFQSMAMITRLQEEKAALHMEALQYLRMMEEQAAYDDETLQKSKDFLTVKEKEVQDLGAQLEFYRTKFPNESLYDLEKTSCEMKKRDIGDDCPEYCSIEEPRVLIHPVSRKPNTENERADILFDNSNEFVLKNSLLEFEDEKMFILQRLKSLENALHMLSNNEVNTSFSEVDFSAGNGTEKFLESELVNLKKDFPKSSKTDEKDDVSLSGLHSDYLSIGNSLLNEKERNESCFSRKSSMEFCKLTDLAHLRTEFSGMNKRLEALEANLEFLEHIIHSLKNGDEGLQFIQEIACHLLELRKISIEKIKTVASASQNHNHERMCQVSAANYIHNATGKTFYLKNIGHQRVQRH